MRTFSADSGKCSNLLDISGAERAAEAIVRKLGGSTGAELVQAPDGRLYVRKRGNSSEHVTEEAYADAAYLAAE